MILTFGGPALFLLAQVYFLRAALGYIPRSRPLGLAALAILAVAAAPFTLICAVRLRSCVRPVGAVRDHWP